MTILEELLEAWRYTRESVIEEVENLPEKRLQKPPEGLVHSVLDLSKHIVDAGRLMAGELARADGDFQRKPVPELIEEHTAGDTRPGSRADAISLLRRSHEEGEAAIRDAGEIHMLQRIRQFDGTHATRLSWMQHGISHEEYHRGQLALYARLFGVTPALTKKIQGG